MHHRHILKVSQPCPQRSGLGPWRLPPGTVLMRPYIHVYLVCTRYSCWHDHVHPDRPCPTPHYGLPRPGRSSYVTDIVVRPCFFSHFLWGGEGGGGEACRSSRGCQMQRNKTRGCPLLSPRWVRRILAPPPKKVPSCLFWGLNEPSLRCAHILAKHAYAFAPEPCAWAWDSWFLVTLHFNVPIHSPPPF